MSSFLHKNVLITGGAGVIGELLARKSITERAENIILWDINYEKLHSLKMELESSSTQIYTFSVDLSQPDRIYETAKIVQEQVGFVDLLFNNAGIVTGKRFVQQTSLEIDQAVKINLLGAMHATRAFLPDMIKQKSGHIVNISSAVSLMANPGMSVYAATKWAVTGWSESLRLELERVHPSLHVTTVQPGYIDTGMFTGVKAPLFTPILDPEKIADKIVNAVKKNKIILREPFMVKLVPILRGILPFRVFDFIAGNIFGVYGSMDTFKGGNDLKPE